MPGGGKSMYLIALFYGPWLALGAVAAPADEHHPSVRGGGLLRRQPRRLGADVYYVAEVADHFSGFALKRRRAVDRAHAAAQGRLREALRRAAGPRDKLLLEGAALADEEYRLEAQGALGSLLNFATTLRQAMGGQGSAASCGELTCGEHAFCGPSAAPGGGAACRCQVGYEGNGFMCNPPSSFVEHSLIHGLPNMPRPQVADLHVATLHGNTVAVAFRDISRLHKGYLMLGKVGAEAVAWGAPVLFSAGSQAFGPAVVELQDGRGLAVAFRNESRGGSGLLLGAAFAAAEPGDGGAGGGGSPWRVTIGRPRAFALRQAQGAVLLPLSGPNVALLFVEHSAADHAPGGAATYGAALVAEVRTDGTPPQLCGKHRFASGPVARLSAAVLSPSAFVVAYRHGETGPGAPRGEASCSYVQVRGSELVFSSRPLALEPERAQIWARGVARLTESTFAYIYHSGNEQLTKQAVLRVDPATHQMAVLQEPTVIAQGFTPYVGAVSTSTLQASQQTAEQLALLQKEGPRLFTYFSEGGATKARARLCKVASGIPAGCKDVAWSDHELVGVSGAPVGDGRLLFVFTDAGGAPRYELVGLMEPS